MTSKTQGGISRRLFVATAAAALAAPSITRAQSRQIVTTLFGGRYEELYRQHVLDPFSRLTGAEFVIRYGSADEWLNNSLINRSAPEIDLPFLSLPVAARAIRIPGLFEPLSEAEIPNLAKVHPVFKDTYEGQAVGFNYVDYGIFYRTDMVEEPITSWADLWRPDLRSMVVAPGPTAGSMYEMVMIAAKLAGQDGNWEAGVEKLKDLRPNIFRWFNTANEVDGLIQRREAAVAAGFGGFRSYAMIDAGVPARFVTPTEGAPMGVLSYHIPTNARNKTLLKEFINFAIGTEQQLAFGNGMPTGVVNTEARLNPEVASRVANPDSLLRLNWGDIQPHFTEITRRMQREVIGE